MSLDWPTRGKVLPSPDQTIVAIGCKIHYSVITAILPYHRKVEGKKLSLREYESCLAVYHLEITNYLFIEHWIINAEWLVVLMIFGRWRLKPNVEKSCYDYDGHKKKKRQCGRRKTAIHIALV